MDEYVKLALPLKPRLVVYLCYDILIRHPLLRSDATFPYLGKAFFCVAPLCYLAREGLDAHYATLLREGLSVFSSSFALVHLL